MTSSQMIHERNLEYRGAEASARWVASQGNMHLDLTTSSNSNVRSGVSSDCAMAPAGPRPPGSAARRAPSQTGLKPHCCVFQIGRRPTHTRSMEHGLECKGGEQAGDLEAAMPGHLGEKPVDPSSFLRDCTRPGTDTCLPVAHVLGPTIGRPPVPRAVDKHRRAYDYIRPRWES